MNLYSRKQRWKIVLIALAAIIVIGSIWYTGRIVDRIRKEEREQVRIWSRAVKKKADLVKYTRTLFQKLRQEERKKVQLWAAATKRLAGDEEISNYGFLMRVVRNNTTVPVILADEKGNVISSRNLDPKKKKRDAYLKEQMKLMKKAKEPIQIELQDGRQQYLYYRDSKLFRQLKEVMSELISSFISETVVNTASVPVLLTDSTKDSVIAFGNIDSSVVRNEERLQARIEEMEAENEPIKVDLGGEGPSYVYYQGSWVLTQLQYYPYVQFTIIGLFLLIGYFLFSSFRKAEQNQVWLGMAKETAHQLGTPLSSLMAWMEMLKERDTDPRLVEELQKDVNRLGTITDRFSKIGSHPELEEEELGEVLEEVVAYLRSRSSQKVSYELDIGDNEQLRARINKALFGWVIENLCRNAVDAMEGEGRIRISLQDATDDVYVDVADTGKGIPTGKQRTVFEPGFTSKELGWGLGLSLTKRIIDHYHGGRIFVKNSEPGKGTTFRIVLHK
ncbi:MAG: sensor histidine kinase [Flavobacteriales bacterium]